MLVSEIRIWHTGNWNSTVISISSVKNTLMPRFPGSTRFFPSPEAKGMRREMVECDSVASTQHNKNLVIFPRLISRWGNFPLPTIFAEVFST